MLAILLPTQGKPFLLESLLKSVKVRTFVVNENTIEIENDSPDLHRNPFISRSVCTKGFCEVPGCHLGVFLEFLLKRDHLHETDVMSDPGYGQPGGFHQFDCF